METQIKKTVGIRGEYDVLVAGEARPVFLPRWPRQERCADASGGEERAARRDHDRRICQFPRDI